MSAPKVRLFERCTYCWRDPVAKGLCSAHYQRLRRTGDPLGVGQGFRSDVEPIESRIHQLYLPQVNGCWYWDSSINTYGYGKIKHRGRTLLAHRVMYELYNGYGVGALATEHEVDHVCHTLDNSCAGGLECIHRRCVNPDHLEVVSTQENTRRRDARHERHKAISSGRFST